MTKNEFIAKVATEMEKYPELRFGQAVFNLACRHYSENAENVRGSDLDPFYHDDKVVDFVNAINFDEETEKILKDTDLADIVNRIIHDELIDDCDTYLDFLNDLSSVITKYCGGCTDPAKYSPERCSIAFHLDKEVPEFDGVYKNYDTDIIKG
jgi:hypothetical protein